MVIRHRLGTLLLWLVAAPVIADPGGPEVPGRVIVRLQRGASIESFIDQFEADHADLGLKLQVLGDAADGRYLLGFDPSGMDEDDLEDLEYDLEYNYLDGLLCWGELDHGAKAPEDSSGATGDVWFYVGPNDAPFANQYAVQVLGLPAARDRSTGQGIVVAVLDTGVDASHPALQGRVLLHGFNFVDGNADTSDVGDGQDTDGDGAVDELTGHGTYVASLVHLVAPEAWILPVRVLDSDGHGDSWTIAQGISYAVGRGVEVINLSLGTPEPSDAVAEALDDAWSWGIVAVAAAGNFNSNVPELFPATYGDTMGIAAVDVHDLKAAFSSYNDDLALSAPGASLKQGQEFLLDQSIIGALPGGQYAISEGTSFSAALVSGAAALVRAQHPEWPSGSMTLADVVPAIGDVLKTTAVSIDGLNPTFAGQLGEGRLDAAAAVLAGPPMPTAGDLDNNGVVNRFDLIILLGAWGTVHSSADLSADGVVEVADLLLLVSNWN